MKEMKNEKRRNCENSSKEKSGKNIYEVVSFCIRERESWPTAMIE